MVKGSNERNVGVGWEWDCESEREAASGYENLQKLAGKLELAYC